MGEMVDSTSVREDLFGFSIMFGFFCVRFLPRVRVHACSGCARKVAAPRLTEKLFSVMLGYLPCSGCSVDFVEKLWESMGKSLWKCRGKSFLDLWKNGFYTTRWIFFHVFDKTVEKNTQRFTQVITPVNWRFCTLSTDPTITTINYLGEEKNED